MSEFLNTIRAFPLPTWLWAVTVLAFAFMPGTLMAWLVLRVGRRLAKIHQIKWLKFLTQYFRSALHFLLPALLLYPLAGILHPPLFGTSYFENTVQVVATLLAVLAAIGAVNLVNDLIKKRYDISHADNLRARRIHTKLAVIRRIVIALIVVLGSATTLMMFKELRGLGVSLLASAGVAGIVIGFSAQKVLGNLLAGIQIAMTQPIRLEDAVVVEGEWGWIEEITLTYVVVKIWDRRRLVLPISYFIEKPFQNWTRTTAQILGSIHLYLDYRMPVDVLREKMDEILENTTLWDGDARVLQVIDATENTMVLRGLMTAKDSPTCWDLRCHVREKMLEFIQAKYPEYLPRTRIVVHEIAKPKRTRHDDSGEAATLPLE